MESLFATNDFSVQHFFTILCRTRLVISTFHSDIVNAYGFPIFSENFTDYKTSLYLATFKPLVLKKNCAFHSQMVCYSLPTSTAFDPEVHPCKDRHEVINLFTSYIKVNYSTIH